MKEKNKEFINGIKLKLNDSGKDYSHKKYLTIPESSIVTEISVELPTSRSIVYDMKICLERTDAFIFFFLI